MHQPLSENPGFRAVLFACAGVACIVSVAGFGGGFSWVLDLVVVLAILSLILLLMRHHRLAVVSGLFALMNLGLVLPLYWGAPRPSYHSLSTARAMMLNVNTANTDYAAVLAVIERYSPDFLYLEEVDQRWMIALKRLDATYPHSISDPRSDNFGVAFFSRYPFVASEILQLGPAGIPSVLVRSSIAGREFFILGTHPLPPTSAAYAALRDIQLVELSGIVKRLDAPVLLLGDLNATPWSYPFKRLLRDSALIDGSRGFGLQPTWPAGMFPLLVPIDHCLHSPAIQVVRKEVGPAVGSDHYPVVVEFALRGPGV